ncbi:MAG: ZIP family metal transporter [bacterium]|nr:ZIP family metal transporter [bacterium]
MSDYFYVLFFSLVGGLISLLGGYLLLQSKMAMGKIIQFTMPFAAGALLGAAFFELLPEAIEQTAEGAASRWVLLGIVLFFLLEHFLHWFHHHSNHEDDHASTAAPLIIIGDSVHNLIDGIAIGAAFLVSMPTGMVTALAVAAHEIPQEIGDFGLLLRAGYSKSRVLKINALSALGTTLGALVTFWLGARINLPVGELLAITAGLFVYIAASDLIPAIHHDSKKRFGRSAALILLFGILIVGVATEVAHEYIGNNNQLEERESTTVESEQPGH